MSISFRPKEIDLERIKKIRERRKSVGEKTRNTSIIKFALEYTATNWYPHKTVN